MKLKNTSYAVLAAPTILFIASLGLLCFEYERKLDSYRTIQLQSTGTIHKLKKEVDGLNYMLSMLGGSRCAMKLRGLEMHIDQLNHDLTESYTDVAYCDDLDETLMNMRMTIIELESELGR